MFTDIFVGISTIQFSPLIMKLNELNMNECKEYLYVTILILSKNPNFKSSKLKL